MRGTIKPQIAYLRETVVIISTNADISAKWWNGRCEDKKGGSERWYFHFTGFIFQFHLTMFEEWFCEMSNLMIVCRVILAASSWILFSGWLSRFMLKMRMARWGLSAALKSSRVNKLITIVWMRKATGLDWHGNNKLNVIWSVAS